MVEKKAYLSCQMARIVFRICIVLTLIFAFAGMRVELLIAGIICGMIIFFYDNHKVNQLNENQVPQAKPFRAGLFVFEGMALIFSASSAPEETALPMNIIIIIVVSFFAWLIYRYNAGFLLYVQCNRNISNESLEHIAKHNMKLLSIFMGIFLVIFLLCSLIPNPDIDIKINRDGTYTSEHTDTEETTPNRTDVENSTTDGIQPGVSFQIPVWVELLIVIVLIVALIAYFIYYLLNHLHFHKIKTYEKVEFLNPFVKPKEERVSSYKESKVRKAKNNNERVRKVFYHAIKGKKFKLYPKSATSGEYVKLSKLDENASKKIKKIYDKARYSQQECTADEVIQIGQAFNHNK